MSNKQALRDLQGRLAQRLAAARSEAPSAQWLAVESAGRRFLLPLADAGEIFPGAEVLGVPHTRDWLAGVANLRGQVMAVIDLAAFLRLSPPSQGPAQDGGDTSRLVVLSPRLGLNAALRVDRLLGLRRAEGWQTLLPDPGPRPDYAVDLWQDERGQQWQALDLAKLAADPRFLAVGL